VVFSLHDVLGKAHRERVANAKRDLETNVFDASLFFLIVFLVLREGFEVALFSLSVAVFSDFVANISGMLIGFAGAACVGLVTYFTLAHLPIQRIFKVTGYLIALAGAWFVQAGITKLFMLGNFDFNALAPTPLLPFNFISAAIMLVYLALIYAFFFAQARSRPH
jgi:high-affinity Fe2+/Pb2+ permease